MKARKVRHLDADGTLADNAQRLVAVRLDELCAFMPQAADEAEVTALHDMRIAAKRLRYVLEVTRECFGPYARTAAKRAKELQSLLGEIHDCDEHLPAVEALIDALRAEDAAAVRAAAGAAKDLDAGLAVTAPNAEAYDGLVALATYLTARRQVLYAGFLVRWTELEREGFRARLEYAIGERPEREPESLPEGETSSATMPQSRTSTDSEPAAPIPAPAPATPEVAVTVAAPVPPQRPPSAVPPGPRTGLRPARPLPPLRPAIGRPADQAVSSPQKPEPDERP